MSYKCFFNFSPEKGHGKLWEFIRDLLKEPKYCPSLICWEDHDNGVFRFVSSEKVAKLWGDKRKNNNMNYEKLSRAMRWVSFLGNMNLDTHKTYILNT